MELQSKKDVILSDPAKVYKTINELWKNFPEYDKGRENQFVLYLDVKNKLLCIELHAQGTIDSLIVYPREIIRKALFSNAGSIILIHNHPSGINTPSGTDIILTKKIKEACKMMDINLLDHLIISANKNYYSFQTEGEL